ncbi:MAG: site-specific integrase, partial [Candidatus Atribacteria bacterium]|nr:site-specific integrase [Candidatus Atribacteria bacterium]
MAQKSKPIQFYDEEKLKKINPETLKLWKKYQMDMELRELSPRTISGYYNDLCHWWTYIYDNQGNVPITELTEDEITEFLYFCKTQGNNSRRMKRRMSSIAAFYKYLRKKKIISENPMEFIDRPKKDTDVVTQTFLTFEQVELMRNKLSEMVDEAQTITERHSALMLRLYAFFSLSTMARVTAVSNTRWDQIDFDGRVVNDVIEKEGYIVTLYFSNEVSGYLRELREFRAENKIDDDGFVFVATYNGKTGAISTGSLNEWCKKIGSMIDVPTLHPHDFRHSGSQLMKLSGAS